MALQHIYRIQHGAFNNRVGGVKMELGDNKNISGSLGIVYFYNYLWREYLTKFLESTLYYD